MARAWLVVGVVLLAGCRAPQRQSLRPLPEAGEAIGYLELMDRARNQAGAATEAFYVDAWTELADAATGLEQTARFLPRATDLPRAQLASLSKGAEQLEENARQLGKAAAARNARGANDALQRINLHIRDLRSHEPQPTPPKAEAPVP